MSFEIKAIGLNPIVWDLGRDKPIVYSDKIEYIQVSGDELGYIKTRFRDLPIAHGHCIWRGEMARFIYDNI